MTNSQLQKSSLFSLLNETGTQQAEGRVRSTSLMEEMSLIGFIPYTDYYLYQRFLTGIDLNGHLYVAPNSVRFSKDTPAYPYFKTISKATGKKYKIDGDLYLDPILDEIPPNVIQNAFSQFVLPLDGNKLLKLMSKYWSGRNSFLKLFTENEDRSYSYIGRDGEWELSNGLGNIVSISNNFLCLCSYMNKVTGAIDYTVLTSDDTIRVLPKQVVPNPFGV